MNAFSAASRLIHETDAQRSGDRCPDWCVTRQARSEGSNQLWHQGPSFGSHISVALFDGRLTAQLDDRMADEMTPSDLRQLAAAALAAAEWIEVQG